MVENNSAAVYSPSKLAFHREKLEALARGEITSPIYVRVKPENRCNHRCFYCSYDPDFEYVLSETKQTKDHIKLEKMMEILDDFKIMGVKAVTYSGGGEPLIYPFIEQTLEKTLENGIDLSIITNGQKLNDRRAELLAKAEWVRISADSFNAELFKKIRRIPESSFYELEENIRNFAKNKKQDCELGINFVINHENAPFVLDSAEYFKNLGVNHIKFSPLYTPRGFEKYHAPFKKRVIEQIKESRKLNDEKFIIFSTYESDFEFSGISERKYARCFIMQTTPVIAADSRVYFCHDKAYSESGLLGSIKDRSFRDLWFSEEAKKIFLNFNAKTGCRHHCAADCRNLSIQKMIDNLEDLDKFTPENQKHKNFV